MVGAKWLPWRSTAGVNARKIAGLVQEITAHLDGLPGTVVKLSTRKMKTDMGVKDVPGKTWKHALHRYLDDRPAWLLEGRSLVRASSIFATS